MSDRDLKQKPTPTTDTERAAENCAKYIGQSMQPLIRDGARPINAYKDAIKYKLWEEMCMKAASNGSFVMERPAPADLPALDSPYTISPLNESNLYMNMLHAFNVGVKSKDLFFYLSTVSVCHDESARELSRQLHKDIYAEIDAAESARDWVDTHEPMYRDMLDEDEQQNVTQAATMLAIDVLLNGFKAGYDMPAFTMGEKATLISFDERYDADICACASDFAKYCDEYEPETSRRDYAALMGEYLIRIHADNSPTRLHSDSVMIPTDRVNQTLFALTVSGNIKKPINVEKRGDAPLKTVCAINFDSFKKWAKENGIEMDPRLDAYDFRLYTVVFSFMHESNMKDGRFFVKDILKQMGYEAGTRQRERFEKSFVKMLQTTISIDNEAEAARYKYNHIKWTGQLIQGSILTESATLNGQETRGCIEVNSVSPLFSLAIGRKQYTTVPARLYMSPKAKTERALRLENYLIPYIARKIRDGRKDYKKAFEAYSKALTEYNKQTPTARRDSERPTPPMLNSITIIKATLHDYMQDTDPTLSRQAISKRKAATLDATKAFLEHAKTIGYIDDYDATKDKFIVKYSLS